MLPLYALNAGCAFFISCSMASHHNLSPFYLSILMAYLTECGMCSPFLCVFCQYLLAVFDMILSLFLGNFFIHHANDGSSAILLNNLYLASYTEKESLTYLTWFQVEIPSFHRMKIFPSFVDLSPLLVSIGCMDKGVPLLYMWAISTRIYDGIK